MNAGDENYDEDISYYSKKGEYLEDLFTLRDFLNNPTTRKILEDKQYNDFEKYIIPKIINIYEDFKDEYKDTRILHRDTRRMFLCDLISIVNKHIAKKYDLEIFYENPDLANDLIKEYEENKK